MDYRFQPTAGPGSQNYDLSGGIFGGAGSQYLNSNITNPGATGGGLNQWFQNNQSTMQGIGQGLGAFTSLAQLYGMFKNLGFQKKAFKFAQEGTKRNFNAQAQGFNNEVENRHDAERTYAQSQGNDFESLASYSGRRNVNTWT